MIWMFSRYCCVCSVSQSVSSVAQSCPTLCDPMNRSTPGLPVHHQLPEFTQTCVHWVGDAIQPSHPGSSPSISLQSFPVWGSFQMSQFFTSGGQSFGVSASASTLPMSIQDWFNMLSRLVITFPPRSKHLLISWLQSPSAVVLEPRKIKSATVSTVYPSICMNWWDGMPWS